MVGNLLAELREDLNSHALNQGRREEILGLLKVLGRDAKNIRNVYNETGISVLGSYAFGSYPITTAREALRCIANALLLQTPAQHAFVQNGLATKAADALSIQNDDDEFLLSRILFLVTLNKTISISLLVELHGLAENIVGHINRHAKETGSATTTTSSRQIDTTAALSETLKLLFSLTTANPEYIDRCSLAVPDLLRLLIASDIPSPPLQPPLIHILNALANLELLPASNLDLSPAEVSSLLEEAVDKLISIFDSTLRHYKPGLLDIQGIPLLTVLRKINQAADERTKNKMRMEFLPKDSERDQPLGKSSTLASSLLKLITSPGVANLPEAVSGFLFELSDKDPSTYVKNVGYGYAAGYLVTHNIPIPESAREAQQGQGQIPVNPVTGQRLDKEPSLPDLNMTQEEKEREAERLFVLFDRLKKTGVVDVKNPVQQAMEEGRFEELSDSDDS